MMSNPAVQKAAAAASRNGNGSSSAPRTPIHAPAGAMASDSPSQRCESAVKRLAKE